MPEHEHDPNLTQTSAGAGSAARAAGDSAPTERIQPGPASPAAGQSSHGASRYTTGSDPAPSPGWIEHGRFPAGTVLLERYRIIERLGAGGMGEVYRADDLQLAQSIAMKFLFPRAGDARMVEQLRHEVRTARQISHPHVCRVYDIGQIEGLPFLSMEYVDGENLASLLRRIGRLPEDKAIEFARQLCAGLAAAHEQGVVHCDLKPGNVMVDGRGRLRITDFGLAGMVDQLGRAGETAGTPLYMAPEQLSGKGASPRSDIYALGLVLYEMFTGRRAFEGRTFQELRVKHEHEPPTQPSSLVRSLNPAIERIILRCLEKDPARRPSSALAVAASLPGGDPLAAALAAGETPSPQLVAAAGAQHGIRPRTALLLFAATVLGILGFGTVARDTYLAYRATMPRSPAVLADRARDMLYRLGYTKPPYDTAYGFLADRGYVSRVVNGGESWAELADDAPPPILFWYRESPYTLAPLRMEGKVDTDDPWSYLGGMVNITLSPLGRLETLRVVPPRIVESGSAAASQPAAPDWRPLFEMAGLDESRLSTSSPLWNPTVYCDARGSWRGVYPSKPDVDVFVEAAALRGKPVMFEVRCDWDIPIAETGRDARVRRGLNLLVFGTVGVCILGALWLVWRNVRLGRGDVNGAWRIALAIACTSLLGWAMGASHTSELQHESDLLSRGVGMAMLQGGLAWMLYLALEPTVRRRWPDALIGWSRLLAGQWRDPLVGRDLLVGAFCGVLSGYFQRAPQFVPPWFGAPGLPPTEGNLPAMLLPQHTLELVFELVTQSVSLPMFLMLIAVLALIVVRERWLALLATYVCAVSPAFMQAYFGGWGVLVAAFVHAIISALLLVVLLRFGMLTLIAAMCYNLLLTVVPLTFDFSLWFAVNALITAAPALALAAFAFSRALGGRPLLAPHVLDG